MEEIKNAKIESTMLGYEDHGLLTCFLYLDYGGVHQGFGGYRIDNEYCARWVKGILDIVGVTKWEDLKGRYIRVKAESGWNGKIIAIGNLIEDKWFNPSDEK